MTFEEIVSDYWAHKFFDNPKAAEEVVDYDFDDDEVARLIGEAPTPTDHDDDWEEVT